jgi:hypothetical protein
VSVAGLSKHVLCVVLRAHRDRRSDGGGSISQGGSVAQGGSIAQGGGIAQGPCGEKSRLGKGTSRDCAEDDLQQRRRTRDGRLPPLCKSGRHSSVMSLGVY